MDFTYKAYENMIDLLRKNEYNIWGYHDYKNFRKSSVLRHDVDSSLNKALEMAELEHSLGVKSTYFILLTSDFYNIASKKSNRTILQLHKLWHEIGLHFDEKCYDFAPDEKHWMNNITECILKEANIMENLLGFQIKSVSMHRPSEKTLNADLNIENMVNSYSNEFFNKFKYVSDSRRCWREDIELIIKSNHHKRLHILTHAFWYNDIEKSISESITEFVNSANMERYEIQEDGISNLRDIMTRDNVII